MNHFVLGPAGLWYSPRSLASPFTNPEALSSGSPAVGAWLVVTPYLPCRHPSSPANTANTRSQSTSSLSLYITLTTPSPNAPADARLADALISAFIGLCLDHVAAHIL